MMNISEETLRIANEIAHQIGGKKFEETTGAHFLLAMETPVQKNPILVIALPENKSGANALYIEYRPCPDTYRVVFSRINEDGTGTDVESMEDVYCDMLQDVFTRVTGISTEGCRVEFG